MKPRPNSKKNPPASAYNRHLTYTPIYEKRKPPLVRWGALALPLARPLGVRPWAAEQSAPGPAPTESFGRFFVFSGATPPSSETPPLVGGGLRLL